MNSVLVGMSGGVDSSVTALVLMEKYAVAGATMKLFDSADILPEDSKTCCAVTDVEDARRVCDMLGIIHHTFNFRAEFQQQVIERFAAGYIHGQTPNPCIDCNRFVKFPHLLRRARQLGIEYIATGHYARVAFDDKSGRYRLMRGLDLQKDQSYVLYAMTQDELAHTLFPLGERTKQQIRDIAATHQLRTADKPESQDICFVPDGDYGKFLREKMEVISTPGDVVDAGGRILGQHRGLIHYTIGQRRGLGIAAPNPLYVTAKDLTKNQLIVSGHADLLQAQFSVCDVNWISIETLDTPLEVCVMTRYRDEKTSATLYPLASGQVQVRLHEPKRAITPGQAAVFYHDDVVVGGGVIVG